MGNYATASDLTARFLDSEEASFATDSEDTGAVDAAVQNEVINDAEGIIDSHAGMRFKTPVDVSSDTVLAARLKSLTLDLALHSLALRTDRASEILVSRFEAAMEYLDKIANGKLMLPSAATLDSTESRATLIDYGKPGSGDASDRIFTRDTQSGL